MKAIAACSTNSICRYSLQTARPKRANAADRASHHKLGGRAYLLCGLLISALIPSLHGAIPAAEYHAITTELHQPIEVHLRNGRSLLGQSIDVTGNRIQIACAQDAGQAIYTFERGEIAHFTLPGEHYKALALAWIDSGERAHALQLMRLLYLQRVKLLPLLEPAESHFFIPYVELIRASCKPARALAIATQLKPQIQQPAAQRALDDAILDSYNRLQLYDAARPLAQAWVAERSPYGASALGYYVLGADQLRGADYHAALEQALQPIVFASPNPPAYLAHCYATAIGAALGLGDQAYARILYQEMQQRSLHWPDQDPRLAESFKKLGQLLAKKQNQPTLETPAKHAEHLPGKPAPQQPHTTRPPSQP